MIDIFKYFICFLMYSFIGYIMEIIVCSVEEKKIVNRGFLFGPICPIYGIGALLIVFGLSSYKDNPVLLFFLGMILTTAVEYYTSYIFERIFNNKWWDYSHRKDSINGRVCLGNSICFGFFALLIVNLLQPMFWKLVNIASDNVIIVMSVLFIGLLIIDLISSIIIAYNLRSRIIIAEELKKEKLQMLPVRFEKKYHNQLIKIKDMKNRLIRIYPNLTKNIQKEFKIVTDLIRKEHSKENKKSK